MGQRLIAMRRDINHRELEFSRLAAEFAGVFDSDPELDTSAVAWLKAECRMSAHAAAERVCVGEQLERLPASTESMAGGRIGFAHLALLAWTSAVLSESETAQPFSESPLLGRAEMVGIQAFRTACIHYRHARDPLGYGREEAQAIEDRFLSLKGREDGCLWIKGFLDNEGGAILRGALEPLARKYGADDERSKDRRLADALVEVAGHALDGGELPRVGGQRPPHLQVTAVVQTLVGAPGAPAADLDGGAPLSGEALLRISCDASVTRVVLDSSSMLVDLGRAKRVISPSLRRALVARDGGCRWSGCGRPASYCSGHHLEHWARGGSTHAGNLVLVCARHHFLLHEGGWTAHLAPDGRLVTIPPALAALDRARAPAA
jgi:hypothetical protein